MNGFMDMFRQLMGQETSQDKARRESNEKIKQQIAEERAAEHLDDAFNTPEVLAAKARGEFKPAEIYQSTVYNGMYTPSQVADTGNGATAITGSIDNNNNRTDSDFRPTVKEYDEVQQILAPDFVMGASSDPSKEELIERLRETVQQFNAEKNTQAAYAANGESPLGEASGFYYDADGDITATPGATTVSTTETPASDDSVEYTYKPGDTFGQVLLNLGLSQPGHLWGPGGDVEYYTRQLVDQNMLDERGNVKLGKKFKLTRRK